MRPGVGFTVLAFGVCAGAWLLESQSPERYYLWIQEDGPLEWATFWAFALAAGVWLRKLPNPLRNFWRSAYLLVLGAGCLLVAMEEISWGQRLFGYLPPEIFLTHNYQQELNLHNFADSNFRQLLLALLLGGFGVAWPLMARIRKLSTWLFQQQVAAPALLAIPGFLLAMIIQSIYPWHAAGEWVELLAGLGLLNAAAEFSSAGARRENLSAVVFMPFSLALGFLTASLTPAIADETKIRVARQETQALVADLDAKRLRSRCGVHKRLFTFVEQYGARRMDRSGFFAGETDAADDVRKRHYLDPWNLPYWIRHQCDAAESRVFVYSFGPNRRRDSSERSLGGDDVGWYVGREDTVQE